MIMFYLSWSFSILDTCASCAQSLCATCGEARIHAICIYEAVIVPLNIEAAAQTQMICTHRFMCVVAGSSSSILMHSQKFYWTGMCAPFTQAPEFVCSQTNSQGLFSFLQIAGCHFFQLLFEFHFTRKLPAMETGWRLTAVSFCSFRSSVVHS